MVTYLFLVTDEVEVFRALADPVRRTLLDRLFDRNGQTLLELCEGAEMTRFGVMKHLRVLEAANLVTTRKVGREKFHYLNPVPIRLIHDRWVSKYTAPFAAALSGLKTRLEGTMSDASKTQVYEVFIHATPQAIWDAITKPEFTALYVFGTAVDSTFRPGDPITYRMGEAVAVDGKVLESDPPRRLVHTWTIKYDPTLAHETSKVTYTIEQRGEVCKVRVLHELPEAPLTAEHVAKDGWSVILSGLKTLLETKRPLPMMPA